jgi:hypothetical protein
MSICIEKSVGISDYIESTDQVDSIVIIFLNNNCFFMGVQTCFLVGLEFELRALCLQSRHTPHFSLVSLKTGSLEHLPLNYLLQLALNCDPLDLSLSNSWDCKCEPPALSNIAVLMISFPIHDHG